MLTGWERQKQMNHLSCRSVPSKWRGVQWCAGQCFSPICHICFPRLKSTVKVMKKGQQQNIQDFTTKTPVQGAGEDGPGLSLTVLAEFSSYLPRDVSQSSVATVSGHPVVSWAPSLLMAHIQTCRQTPHGHIINEKALEKKYIQEKTVSLSKTVKRNVCRL